METMKLRKWDTVEYLKTEEDMVQYLQACMDEAGDDAAFIAAALAEGESRLGGYSPCGDNEAAIAVAKALGAKVLIESEGSSLQVGALRQAQRPAWLAQLVLILWLRRLKTLRK